MRKVYNCNDCLYANELENGDIYCDKREFEGITCIIPKDKIYLNCPSHSDYIREETRYMRPWKFLHEADDVCQVCHRMLDLQDKNQYKYVEVKKDDGGKNLIRKCSICIKKGR